MLLKGQHLRSSPGLSTQLEGLIAVLFSLQLLFDFLAFKNDISFWKKKKSMIGMSTKAGRCAQNLPLSPGPVPPRADTGR